VLESWGLPENQLACATTDSGSYIVAAMRKLKWSWLSCFGHHQLIKDDSQSTHAIDISYKIVYTFAHSWKKDLTQQ